MDKVESYILSKDLSINSKKAIGLNYTRLNEGSSIIVYFCKDRYGCDVNIISNKKIKATKILNRIYNYYKIMNSELCDCIKMFYGFDCLRFKDGKEALFYKDDYSFIDGVVPSLFGIVDCKEYYYLLTFYKKGYKFNDIDGCIMNINNIITAIASLHNATEEINMKAYYQEKLCSQEFVYFNITQTLYESFYKRYDNISTIQHIVLGYNFGRRAAIIDNFMFCSTHNDFSIRNIGVGKDDFLIVDWEISMKQNGEHDLIDFLLDIIDKLSFNDFYNIIWSYYTLRNYKNKGITGKDYVDIVESNYFEYLLNRVTVFLVINLVIELSHLKKTLHNCCIMKLFIDQLRMKTMAGDGSDGFT